MVGRSGDMPAVTFLATESASASTTIFMRAFSIRINLSRSDYSSHSEASLFAPPPSAPSCSARSHRPACPASTPDRRFATLLPHNPDVQTTSCLRPWRLLTPVRTHPPHPAGHCGYHRLHRLARHLVTDFWGHHTERECRVRIDSESQMVRRQTRGRISRRRPVESQRNFRTCDGQALTRTDEKRHPCQRQELISSRRAAKFSTCESGATPFSSL